MSFQILLINCYAGKEKEKILPYCSFIETSASNQGLDVTISVVDDEAIASGKDNTAYDTVIISGSRRMLSGKEYLQGTLGFVLHCRRPLLGICYGHQLLARAFVATVIKDDRSHHGDEEMFLKVADPLFGGFPERFLMNQSHEEVVEGNAALLKSFELLAVNSDGRVEAIRHRDLPLWGVQFHPERSGEFGQQLVVNFLRRILPEPS